MSVNEEEENFIPSAQCVWFGVKSPPTGDVAVIIMAREGVETRVCISPWIDAGGAGSGGKGVLRWSARTYESQFTDEDGRRNLAYQPSVCVLHSRTSALCNQ